MHHVGLDVGDQCSSIEILDQNGKHFKHLEVKGRWPVVLERMRQEVPRPFSVCFEASNGYGYLHEQLSTMAQRVSVAHPGQLRLIFRAKRKHNRVDAVKLAKLQYLGEVPEVHVPGLRVREWRATIEYRQRLLHQRVRSKNQIRALLKSQGIQIPGSIRSLWTRKGTAWLKSLELHESQSLRRDIMLDELHSTNDRIHLVERYLRKVSDGHPGVTLLRTIPGVGVRTAEAVCAYVDDIKRFGRIRQLSAYFGMIPCQDASGNVNRLGHITKDGPATQRGDPCVLRADQTERSAATQDRAGRHGQLPPAGDGRHAPQWRGLATRNQERTRPSDPKHDDDKPDKQNNQKDDKQKDHPQDQASAPCPSPPEDTGHVSWALSSDGRKTTDGALPSRRPRNTR